MTAFFSPGLVLLCSMIVISFNSSKTRETLAITPPPTDEATLPASAWPWVAQSVGFQRPASSPVLTLIWGRG